MKKKSIIILLFILAVVAGGFFYFWYIWLPAQIAQEQQGPAQVSTTTPPTLFGKEDYKIEERADGKYIVVPKVGLTVKVPEGWKVEYKRTADIEPQYWVDLLSPDLTTTTSNVLTNGCKISITAGNEEENNKETKARIKLLKENPNTKPEEISYIYKNYTFKVIKISNHDTLNWTTPEHSIIGQATGIDIPIGKKELIDITMAFPLENKEKCFQIWEDFLENIVIE